ncbi:MAG: protein-glutamate O-methyltransferase CheR [Deltaproteobacteria bacterium]|jgi:chemotaxis protein methyltransferase CheR|nr:protein-glutamate O-methyltransferase CheR [Deltaproteobacteria bacterium]
MTLHAADFDYLRRFLYERSAIVLDPGKEYLVESRLVPLARKEGLSGIDTLVSSLRAGTANGLIQKVVEAMTTNETSFYRDNSPFELMRTKILPSLVPILDKERTLRIWSAAASTGQEIYSIAMILRDHFPQLASWKVQLLATDLSRDVLAKAREGRYNQLEVNRGLPASMLVKHFEKRGMEWQLKADIRQQVEFREMNLATNWPAMPPMDVVFLRNVLIYFDVETKRQILGRVRRVLRPHGFLFLGGAETTFQIDDGFERVALEKATVYRLRSAG